MPSTDPESPFDVRVRASAARGRTRRDEAPTDAAWIDAVIAEEPWAQRRFVEALSPRIRRVLTRVLGGGADIDDLTQDTLLRALSRLGTLREKDKLEAFVAKIAVFVGREALRARRRRRWPGSSPRRTSPSSRRPGAPRKAAAR
ncbi:MAG: sigma factor [Polyangiaceae bacterium]